MQPPFRFPSSLLGRIALLALLFTLELVSITIWLDGAALSQRGGLIALLGLSGSWLLRGMVAFAAMFVLFGIFQMGADKQHTALPFSAVVDTNRTWIAVHIFTLGLFAALAWLLFESRISGPIGTVTAVGWLASGCALIATGAGALVPFHVWRQLLRTTGRLWIYALATSVLACLLGAGARSLWASAAGLTFVLVKALLALFLSGVFANLSTLSIGTKTFHVEIAPECSGLEGAALILGFCVLWLWLLRSEFRFPRALLLAPASVAVLFFLNAVRIAALILIGNAGAPDIALGGFHSQAGWIAFNAVAIALMVAARRVQWLTVSPSGNTALSAPDASHDNETAAPASPANPAAPYLVPFLAILAAAILSRAASGGFEWLYPLRLLACGVALWIFRTHYRKLDWHFGWEAPAIGVLVFAIWLAGDFLAGIPPQNLLPASPNRWIATAQILWLICRLLSSIVTAPIAEELAFRGYLIRRILSTDFEALSPKTFNATALVVSSLAFGILHGERWIAGTIAGLLYAGVMVRRGRIGDAVIAHATTNGLLAASVLVTGQWNLS